MLIDASAMEFIKLEVLRFHVSTITVHLIGKSVVEECESEAADATYHLTKYTVQTHRIEEWSDAAGVTREPGGIITNFQVCWGDWKQEASLEATGPIFKNSAYNCPYGACHGRSLATSRIDQ